jgi:hypothetical protein
MENQEQKNSFASIHTPIALVGLALSVLFFSQILTFGNKKKMTELQSSKVGAQINAYKDAKEKLAKAIEQRGPAVKESSDLQLRFGKLIKKVNELSKGDEKDEAVKDAKNIINILVSSGINSINVPDDPADQKK